MKRLARRTFLGSAATVLGTSLVEGCKTRLPRSLVPYVTPPDDTVPGLAVHYRTTCRACPAACGMTARVREGRAVMLEGSPDHPLSRGGLCPVGQASIETLYGPGRLGSPWAGGKPATWPDAEKALAAGLRTALDSGKAVVVLTRPEPGLLGGLLTRWLAALGQPATHRVVFDFMARPWLREGQRRALGSDAVPVHRFEEARLILSVGDDLVEEGSPVEAARGLAEQRAKGGRSIYVGPRLSLTAASCDEWISVEPGSELALVLALCGQVLQRLPPGVAPSLGSALGKRLARFDPEAVASRTGLKLEQVKALAQVLLDHRPCLVLGPGRALAGSQADRLSEAVHVLNALLGNVGSTLRLLAGAGESPGWDLAELERQARAGAVAALVIHQVDPLGCGQRAFAEVLGHVPFVVALAGELDDTARRAHLVFADHHFLESWGDASPRPGVVSVQQPVMSPVLDTRAAADTLLGAARALGRTSGLPEGSWADVVRAAYDVTDRERGLKLTEPTTVTATLAPGALAEVPEPAKTRGPAGGLTLVAAPNLRQLDGRPYRSALLQEIPNPLSGYAWTGWIELNPTTAGALGVQEGDVVALDGPGGAVELPAHVTPGIRAGMAACPAPDALPLLDRDGPPGLELRVTARKTGARKPTHLAAGAAEQHGRELARSVSLAEPALPHRAPLPQMYAAVEHPEHRWGMAIDLDRCTGCGTCTAACYVENNLSVVGAEDVQRGRSMSWMRIHAYVDPRPEGLETSFLPLSCQHCTNAPCEVVCPTFATYHTREGVNAQIYPRCIGTRYCENNCPYGVRRFNFFDWPRHGLRAPRAQPGRQRPRARGEREVLALRAANHRRAGAGEDGEPAGARRGGRLCLRRVLPHQGHRLRGPARSGLGDLPPGEGWPGLPAPRGSQHPARCALPRAPTREGLTLDARDLTRIERDVVGTMSRTSWRYWLGLGISVSLVLVGAVAWSLALRRGLGVFGLNEPVMWGSLITTFVFFIGVSHSGTLVSAILFFARSPLRAAIGRAAEAMTVDHHPHRRALPDHPHRAVLALLLRARLPQPAAALAELPLATHLGRVRDQLLRHGERAVPLHGDAARPGDALAAGDRLAPAALPGALARLRRDRRRVGAVRAGVPHLRWQWSSRWRSRCTASSRGTSRCR